MDLTHDMLATVQYLMLRLRLVKARGKAVTRLERIEAYLIERMCRDA